MSMRLGSSTAAWRMPSGAARARWIEVRSRWFSLYSLFTAARLLLGQTGQGRAREEQLCHITGNFDRAVFIDDERKRAIVSPG